MRRRMGKMESRHLRNGLIFASPWLIGFAVFISYPFFASLYYSLTQFAGFGSPKWVGFSNYRDLFIHPLFAKSLYNTLFYSALAIPSNIVVGIGIAMLLNIKVKGMAIYRTVFYIPTIVPLVATAILWMWLFNPNIGLINHLLRMIGLPGPGWIADIHWAKPSLVIMNWWRLGGPIIIYLAGLQNIPQQLYEAADLDGASLWKKFVNVTLPMLSPVIFFNLIMGLIGSFQYFTEAYVITDGAGGPANATLFYSLYLYREAFIYLNMGYASAMAWVLFIMILGCTFLLFRTSRWVYYAGITGK